MSFVHNNIWLIIIILLLLIIIEGFIIYLQDHFRNEDKKEYSRYVPMEKHRQILEERDNLRDQLKEKCNNQGNKENDELLQKCLQENDVLNQNVDRLNRDNKNLEQKIRDLNREIDELNEFRKKSTFSSYDAHGEGINTPANEESKTDINAKSSQPLTQNPVSTGVSMDNNAVEDDSRDEFSTGKTMYASFPRSAGSSVYFSDLSDNRADDSYFEFKISIVSGKAIFKPIDFMKIRNYDEAMAAMRTEGAKPNVATTVLGIMPGGAHKEENDWIIDDFATIKLA